MTRRQEAKFKMYRVIEAWCDNNVAITSLNAAFTVALGDFKVKIVAIDAMAQQREVPITGIAVDKSSSKQQMCEAAADTAALVYAFAATRGDATLKAEVNFSVSELMRMRESSLAERCQAIHDTGAANLAALNDYGVTAAKLTALQTLIDAFTAETPKPRTAIAERKTETANLVALFKDADQILEERMDKLVVAFKAADPDFVSTYDAARRVTNPPTTTTQLKGVVTDEKTGAPVVGANVTVTPAEAGAEGAPETVKTDGAGVYLFKPLAENTYTIAAAANGYTDSTDTVRVFQGEINHCDIELAE